MFRKRIKYSECDILSLQMCALAEKRTIDTLIDGGSRKSGDFDHSITQCKCYRYAMLKSYLVGYCALMTVILAIDNYLLGRNQAV